MNMHRSNTYFILYLMNVVSTRVQHTTKMNMSRSVKVHEYISIECILHLVSYEYRINTNIIYDKI